MNPKIKAHHLQRKPFLYARQSSPTQVREHTGGLERQLKLRERLPELGWPADSVVVIKDLGLSGRSMNGRDGIHELLQAIQAGEAGIVLVAEASRLARDNIDFHCVIRYCSRHDVLLADEDHVYDTQEPQDKMLLGIQGAMAEYELSLIQARMHAGFWNKAEEGKLFPSIPSGYILEAEQLLKHPDQRVQNIYELVFEAFPRFPSVKKFWEWFLEKGYELPRVPHGGHYTQVEWRAPTNQRMVDLLHNPAYAGAYVIGRTRTEETTNEAGEIVKRRRRVPMEEWQILLYNQHDPYIPWETFLRNYEKVAMNAPRRKNRSAPREGHSLLQSMVRCGHCGRSMSVHYSEKGIPQYRCTRHTDVTGQPTNGCFSFTATRAEDQISQAILEVVQPAGVQAAALATEKLAAEHRTRRQALVDRLEHLGYEADRAFRQYNQVEPERRHIASILEARLDDKLAEVEAQKDKLETFDEQQVIIPTQEQRQSLTTLGQQLHQVWFHPEADNPLKKQIVRILIREVVAKADKEQNEIQLIVHWSGGHHTEIRVPKRRRKSSPVALKEAIEHLRKLGNDEFAARTLNRLGQKTERGETWTAQRVANFRRKHSIAAFSTEEKEKNAWLTPAEAAALLGLSFRSTHRLVESGILPAKQPQPGLPYVIERQNLHLTEVKTAVEGIKSSPKSPLPENPNQLTLFP